MNAAMILIGIVLGVPLAWGLYQGFRWLRLVALVPVVVIGWIAFALMLASTGILTVGYLASYDVMGPLWEFLIVVVGILSLCAGIAFFQGRTQQIGWPKAFGALMAEAGAVTMITFVLQSGVYVIADIIRGGNRGVGPILDSFAKSRLLLASCEITMICVLLLLEGLYLPLLSRKRTLNPTSEI